MTFEVGYDRESEMAGLIMSLEKVAEGWYLPHRFLVLPDMPQNPLLPVCVIPPLKYGKWAQYVEPVADEVVEKLNSQVPEEDMDVPDIMKVGQVLAAINPDIFPEVMREYWKTVHFLVHPARYGAYCYWTYDRNPARIHLFVRYDQPLDVLCEAAISAVQKKFLHAGFTWEESEAISDYASRLFSPSAGTMERVSLVTPELLQDSIDYLHSLSAPVGPLFREKDNVLYFQDKILNPLLGAGERVLLSYLVRNQGHIVTYDDLAAVVYGTQADAKFSLWGLRKTIQRLRSKLLKEGIPGSLIHTVSGRGYMVG